MLMLVGVLLVFAQLGLASGDKFFLYLFYWARDIPVMSILSGFISCIAGVFVLLYGVIEMGDY